MAQFGSANSNIAQDKDGNLKLDDLGTAPATATSPGVKGTVIVAANGIYICTATNVWVKATAATF